MADSDNLLPPGEDSDDLETATATALGAAPTDVLSVRDTFTTRPAVPRPRIKEPEPELERGSRIGRYLVLEQLGQGGMGVVYAAYDPKLDRKIALKLLRAGKSGSLTSVRARDRLLREAQALAQLTHPNVIAAYDTGAFHGNVFIAMELVEGQNMKQWLKVQDRPQTEILRVMLSAGRGLAAAHDAGLVHRDIKPENILVGNDGRVLVVDFGLARPPNNDKSSSQRSAESPQDTGEEPSLERVMSTGNHLLDSPVTIAGAIVGTPGYIAPEVYRGEEFDELSDQFSFAVTLYQVLFGQRPFKGKDPNAVRLLTLAGDVRPAPKTAKLKTRYRRLIARGMSELPSNRYPSMHALLAELGYSRQGLGLKIGAVLAIAVLGGTAITLAATRGNQAGAVCTADPHAFDGTWNQAAQTAIARAFEATGRPHAPRTFERASTLITERVSQWESMQVEACRATHVHRVQSPALLDLKTTCLDRRRDELNATLTLFRDDADSEVVDTAVLSLHELPRLEACGNSESLLAAVPPPATVAARERATVIRRQLDTAAALQRAGKYKAGVSIAEEALQLARDLDYSPLIAEAAHRLGWLQARSGSFDRSEATLREATGLAAHAKDKARMAAVAVSLLDVVGNKKRKYEQALAMSGLVEALITLAGSPPELLSDFLASRGFLYARTDRLAQAVATLERAITIAERAFGENDLRIAHVLNQLGFARIQDKGYKDARAHLSRALAIWERVLGPEHPKVAIALNNLGQIQSELGDHDAAFVTFDRARALYATSLGDDHPKVAIALTNLAGEHEHRGECSKALPHLNRAIEIWTGKIPDDHPFYASVHGTRGRCLIELSRPAEAIAGLERAIEIRSSKGSKARRSIDQFSLARALWDTKRDRQRALKLAQEAREQLAGSPEADEAGKELAQMNAWLRKRNR